MKLVDTTEKPKNLAEYDGEYRVISSYEIEQALRNKPDSVITMKSLIPSLDAAIEGFQEGELITVSGPTKQGKTLFCQSLTMAFEKQLYPSLWFSFEVPYRQFLSQFRQLPLIYMPEKLKAHALDWFKERVQESFEKFHTRIIFVDHLHYLIDLARIKNPSIEIGQIIRQLKSLAVEGQYVIFLLCHTTKGASEDNLSYESIRDSSFVAQESDSVFMIKRTPREDCETSARLIVEFHRRTGVMEKVVNLIKHNGYLVEEERKDKHWYETR